MAGEPGICLPEGPESSTTVVNSCRKLGSITNFPELRGDRMKGEEPVNACGESGGVPYTVLEMEVPMETFEAAEPLRAL